MRTAILVAACVTAGAIACSDASSSREVYTPSGPITLPPVGVETINLSPTRATLVPGGKTRLSAMLRDGNGSVISGVQITWKSSDNTIATVTDSGDVQAVRLGNALVTASADNLSASSAIVVGSAPVGSVAVSLGSQSISVGTTTQASVVVKDSTGAVVTDRVVTWSSSAPGIATVSSTGMVTGVAAGSATISATSEGKVGSAGVTITTPSPAPVATVSVSLGFSSLSVGSGGQATAVLKDASGNVLTGRAIAWTSSNSSVATVSSSGFVQAVALGSATITATSEGVNGSASLSVVAAPVASVTVTLNSSNIAAGQSTQANAVTKDAAGNVLTGRSITWSSSNTSVATVSSTGSVQAVAAGSATITATSEGVSGSAGVTVTQVPVASIAVTLNPASVTAGQTAQASAVLRDAQGNVLTGRTITWSSSSSVATVSSGGLVQSVTAGTATISATSGGITGSATLTVTQVPVASVTVTLTQSLTIGQTTQATAVTKDASGNVLSGRTVSWSSSNTAVATVNASGMITAVAAGSANIIAISEGVTGQASVSVAVVPVASVTVSLASSSLTTGQTTQATAVTKDAGGNVLSGRTVTWSSSNTAVATVNASGVVTAVAAGSANIIATSEGVTGQASVSVAVVPVASVTVSLASSNLTVGQTSQASAVTKDAAGNVLTGRTITWNSSNTAVATVSTSGLVTAKGAGTASITATSGGISGSASVTVTVAPVATVTLSPASLSLPVGSTGQLTATLKDASGNTLTGRTITWASSATSIATVSGTGLVTAVAQGSATMTATSEGKSGTSAITVTAVVSPGPGVPVYDPTNPDHVLHVFEDWSAYSTSNDVGVKNRADGGGPWLNGNAAFQTLSTSNVDPWFGKKTLDINYQQVPGSGQSLENGLTLIQGTPARYLNASSAKEAIVLEWAWRWEGGPYEGKIADFQPYAGTDRFNYQTDPDNLGAQQQTSCDADPLCSKYYTNNGNTPRFAGLTPQANYQTGAIARSMYAQNPMFYRQNRNWAPGGNGTGSVDWGGNSWATIGITFADNTWRRTILRLTMNSGAMGTGRIEEWMQIAGQPAVKVMEFIGDPGGFDAGLVNGRDVSQGGNTWVSTSATLYLYNLSAVGPIFVGGNTTHLGYVRIWSESRQ